MAEKIFIGGAATAAQINTETPDASPAENDVYKIKLADRSGNEHTISYTADATPSQSETVAGLVAAGVAAAAAGTAPWNAVTCTDTDPAVTITADVAGQPFWVTTTATGGGSPTLTDAAVTACAGPSIVSTAENWEGGAVPVNGDTFRILATVTTDIYGKDFTGATCGGWDDTGYAGAIGSLARPLELDMETATAYADLILAGTGVKHLKLTDWNVAYVRQAATSPGTGQYGLNLTGLHNSATSNRGTIQVDAGQYESIGIAANPGEDMEINQLNITGAADVTVGSTVTVHDDAAAVPLNMSDGTLVTKCAMAAGIISGGTWTHEGTGAVTSIAGSGGTVFYNSTGTLTTGNIASPCVLDFSQNVLALTVTNLSVYATTCLNDVHGNVTYTNGIDFVRCALEGLPPNKTVSLSAI